MGLVPHQEQTSGKDGESFCVKMAGQGVAEALVTACDQHCLPLGLQEGKKKEGQSGPRLPSNEAVKCQGEKSRWKPRREDEKGEPG